MVVIVYKFAHHNGKFPMTTVTQFLTATWRVERTTKRLLAQHFRIHPFVQSVIIFLLYVLLVICVYGSPLCNCCTRVFR